MKGNSQGPLCSRLIRQAMAAPSRLGRQNETLWEDIREVMLDPEPDSPAIETIRRWLRDEIEADLYSKLHRATSGHLVSCACHIAPRMIWKLPHSRCRPSRKYHRRIMAILLPHRLGQIEKQLAIRAFLWGLRHPDHHRNN